MTESPLMDSGFAVLVFSPGDDPIACLNKSNATSSGGNDASRQARVVKCYNCQGEGHMARQCTQPKRPRNVALYKDKAMLAEAQEAGQILDEEQLAFLTDPGLSGDFGKRFTPQQELSAKLAFWLRMSNPSCKSSDASPVKIEAPKELPKVSLVNESLKKLKFHLARFDNVVKKRTTPDARTEDHPNEIMEVHTVFDQMEADVQQSSVDKQCLEIAKKELLLENDRLLQKIMSQDVLLTMMNYMSLIGESVNMERRRNESCDKCFNLDNELLKSQNAHNDLLKSYSQLEKHCMFKLDLEPLAPRLLQNMEAHIDYLKYTQEQADILREIVKQAKAKQPLDKELNFSYKHAQQIQELLVYVRDTCPNAIKLIAKKVTITSKNNVKKIRFAEPLTSSSNIKQVKSSTALDSNTPVLSPTGLNCSTSN
ncbi:integrase, catalytic region, zinc finger, CCHC-type containing protein [Tanacetum coccineum]|uniref:Integrase, catalytic region, zinc finger, CCHC-type containing protein n=1 Tax=Tanacetum coccineum TaxID=301880 RepID=A0ABQ5IMQ0_9ASTR